MLIYFLLLSSNSLLANILDNLIFKVFLELVRAAIVCDNDLIDALDRKVLLYLQSSESETDSSCGVKGSQMEISRFNAKCSLL